MGDIFRRETAEHPEAFTGERLTTAAAGQVQIEHYHRYLFARSLVGGLDVLDVASGEGYGSAFLAQVARSVIGVERSAPTVACAATNFPRPNLRFIQADARALPLADSSIDTVVSLETIEHFDRHSNFLGEVRRVLRPEGCFIVSTPDRDIYSPAGTAANPYHVRELSRSEFTELLHGSFEHVRIMQQRPLVGSALLADTASPAPPLVFERRGATHFEACVGLPRAPYLIAVASDCELHPLPPCLYIDRSDLDTDALRQLALADQLRRAQADVEQATRQVQEAKQGAADAEQRAVEAEQRAAETRQEADRAREDVEHATRRAEQAIQRAEHSERRGDDLQFQYDLLRGSLRTFLRGYLPLLRRHLFGPRS
jgi:SAM-dependent methyltransferase